MLSNNVFDQSNYSLWIPRKQSALQIYPTFHPESTSTLWSREFNLTEAWGEKKNAGKIHF